MALIPFPNVPDVPGVPALPRSPTVQTVVDSAISFVQGVLWRAAQTRSQWGIWDKSGNPLGDPSSITGWANTIAEAAGIGSTLSTGSVEYSKEVRISDFPIERGSFAAYNKVETPATPVVVLCMQGTEKNRRTFLNAIDTACKSTALYDIITPEVRYIDYSIERYNYQRASARGTTLLVVEISLKEIRQVSATYTTNAIVQPKDISATPQSDNGKVQPKAPDVSLLKSISTKIPSLLDTARQYMSGVLK